MQTYRCQIIGGRGLVFRVRALYPPDQTLWKTSNSLLGCVFSLLIIKKSLTSHLCLIFTLITYSYLHRWERWTACCSDNPHFISTPNTLHRQYIFFFKSYDVILTKIGLFLTVTVLASLRKLNKNFFAEEECHVSRGFIHVTGGCRAGTRLTWDSQEAEYNLGQGF